MRLALTLLVALALPAVAQSLKPWKGGATPALELEDVQGKVHRLSEYRGRVVLLNFWATWCTPCREEMPSIAALQKSLEGRPFVVLAVNVGEGAAAARTFGEKMALPFPLLLDREMKTTRNWGARLLPASYVIGADGKVVYSYLGATDWSVPEVKKAIERLIP
ncbi:MAG TPA: TlpA disulfide reductase family protein [Burkholderiales bacterium]|jgi:thiol-disulfide isomerase/thioredoxin